ncbi:methyltransferase domain-containing protein [Psychromarinibacter sp. S121]|uniref:methyltransferase domain-containing protein n=1 Tax=Psychromarinibacter sp. S121 TaxID=3415127 RepID=UPI003C7B4063
MADPFQNVDAHGSDFVETVVSVLYNRAHEPVMAGIVDDYLAALDFPDGGVHIEIGAGSGDISRQIAARAKGGGVIGIDPSEGLIAAAKKGAPVPGLSFETGDGAALRFGDGSVDNVVMHTVLSHVPDPARLLSEAARVLKPGGRLVVCDADFEKMSLGNGFADPMQACAQYFAEHFVTDKYLTARLRPLVMAAGLTVERFSLTSRTITSGTGARNWVAMGGRKMVETGLIGPGLLDALLAEHDRRAEEGTLFGHQPFVTLHAMKPRA